MPEPVAVPPDAVAECAGGSYWTVSGGAWADGDGLPEELAELLAPPIVVGAASTERVTADGRAGRHRRA
jgi:hypothetical protein